MKLLLKASALVLLLTITSCAHHKKCGGCGDKKQCDMKEGKNCSSDKEQCHMKKEEAKTEEPKK